MNVIAYNYEYAFVFSLVANSTSNGTVATYYRFLFHLFDSLLAAHSQPFGLSLINMKSSESKQVQFAFLQVTGKCSAAAES
jgi:hypothetical protein